MTWHSPLAFLLFLVVIAYLAYYFLYLAKKTPALQFSSLKEMAKVPTGLRPYLVQVPFYLKILALVFMILAIARPQKTDTKVKRNVEGIDIMMVLDISDSMNIEDMKPVNRMESAKATIEAFVQKRVSDRVGLIIFSGDSYTRVPLTLDYPIFLESLRKVEPSTALKMGTAIGVAVADGVSRLKESTAKSRVIILLTDGESNTGTIDPDTALNIAKGYGIKIYTIGIGQDGPGKMPNYTKDAFGRTIKTYVTIDDSINMDLLNRMAAETGGKSFRATSTGTLQKVFQEIDRLEKTKIEVNKYTRYSELYQSYLAWAFYFLVAAVVLRLTVLRKAP